MPRSAAMDNILIFFDHRPGDSIGKFVLIAHGSMDDTTHAKEILNRTKPETLEYHQ
jgi:hypothetical protein